jgi:hypothetical protein
MIDSARPVHENTGLYGISRANRGAFDTAWNTANGLLAGGCSCSQGDIDAAEEGLESAMFALVHEVLYRMVNMADGRHLSALIDDMELNHPEGAVDAIRGALIIAEEALALTDAIEVMNAVDTFNSAWMEFIDSELDDIDSAIIDALIAAVGDAKLLDQADYRAASWTPFAEALAAAEEVTDKIEANTSIKRITAAGVEALTEALIDAMGDLVEVYHLSTGALEAAIEKAEEMITDLAAYYVNNPLWDVLTQALEDAEYALANADDAA